MNIAGREIGPNEPPYLISEIGGNHGGDLDRAKRLIAASKEAGADACKLQAFTADTITMKSSNPEFVLKDGPWKGRSLYGLYSETQTPYSWFPDLFQTAKDCGIPLFASVFDETAVDLMVELGAPAIKIASFEIVDTPLITYAARTRLPLIISTGMASDPEIFAARHVPKLNMTNFGDQYSKGPDMAFLHCVSAYPTPVSQSNLWRIGHIDRLLGFQCTIGVSDHSLGIAVPIASIALGARIIEKHLILKRSDKSHDRAFSMEPHEFKRMVGIAKETFNSLHQHPIPGEEASRMARRSLYATQAIPKGAPLTMDNVRSIRPGFGLPPSALAGLLGKTATGDIDAGTALKDGMFI